MRDPAAVARINARLRNISLGNAGDARAVGNGLFEMRLRHGPGHRLYCLRDGDAVIVLCGGDKDSQQRDIERAGQLAKEWRQTTERFSKWDATEEVRTLEDALPYMEACADEDPGDGSLIRTALNDVARSGNMAGVARDVGISRECLYKALSAGGNPTLATVVRIVRKLGLRLHIA